MKFEGVIECQNHDTIFPPAAPGQIFLLLLFLNKK